jgi:hypothetical protein
MRFLFSIASTLLIVLISQNPTSGAPMPGNSSELLPMEEMTTFSSYTTEMPEKSSTLLPKKECPRGMEMDHEGQCIARQSSETMELTTESSTKAVDPDACPENYAKFEGACLLVRSKSPHPRGRTTPMKPRVGSVDGEKAETFSVRPDNSCPPGTQYGEHGVCVKRASGVRATPFMPYNGPCPNNGRRIQGVCTYNAPKIVLETTMETLVSEEVTTPLTIVPEEPLEDSTSTKLPKEKTNLQ